MKSLGNLIKEYRTANHLTLREFAALSGLSHSYVSLLEKGVDSRSNKPIEPTLDALEKLSKAMNMPLEQLLTKIGKISPQTIENNKTTKETSSDRNKSKVDVPQEYADKYEVTNLDIKQHAEVLKHAQAFMMDDEVGTDDKQKLFEIVNKLYWESKAINKEKYSKKSKNKK